MQYKDYKKIVMKKDSARVTFLVDIWDFTEEYIDESKMSRETRTIRELDKSIEFYLMDGFAVIELEPRFRSECNVSRCVRTVDRF